MVEQPPNSPPRSNPDARVQRFVGLLTANERHIRSYILSLVPNLADADQIAQETSLRLWEQFDKFDPHVGTFAAWARTIAHFEVLTHRKRLSRERLVFSTELLDEVAARVAVRGEQLAARQAALIDCVSKLPDRSRELIRLCYVFGMKIRAAAEQLGRSVSAVEKAVVRVRRSLYDCVETTLRRENIR